jgi:ADP-ribosylglycohydrolase
MLGVCLPGAPETLAAFVKASTRLTHSDPRAEQGALAVALAAAFAVRCEGEELDAAEVLAELRERLSDDELLRALDRVGWHLERMSRPVSLADEMGLANGVTGYVHHTVPIALFCWLRSPGDFRQAVTDVVSLGGDTDTTAAIVGALAGATVGISQIPGEWMDGLVEWPRSVAWMKRLSTRLARTFPENGSGAPSGPLALFWPAVVLRNVAFLAIVLAHGFRRLLPPY